MLANLQDDEVLVEAQQAAISETGAAIQETEAEQVHIDKAQRGPERQQGEQLLERPPAARPVGKRERARPIKGFSGGAGKRMLRFSR